MVVSGGASPISEIRVSALQPASVVVASTSAANAGRREREERGAGISRLLACGDCGRRVEPDGNSAWTDDGRLERAPRARIADPNGAALSPVGERLCLRRQRHAGGLQDDG